MFKKTIKYVKYKSKLKAGEGSASGKKEKHAGSDYSISKNIDDNLNNIMRIFNCSKDIKLRELRAGNAEHTRALLCFIEGMEDKPLINEYIIKAINTLFGENAREASCDIVSIIKEYVSGISGVSESSSMDKVLEGILYGSSALFIDGYDRVLIFNTASYKTRGIEEPSTEVQVRGPREGFVEDIGINCTLIRRIIKNPNLVFETLKLGEQTQTEIRVAYVKGIANEQIINEVRKRLNRINTDSILESGYIEQFIEDHPFSPFKTIGNSERPDKVAGKLLEGRVAIFCDGTPFVLTVPFLFIESIQVGEDYYSRPFSVFMFRMLRTLALIATVLTPALYIAVTTFHQEMLPTLLLITTAASREGVPFPAMIETIVMITIFEVLRESGIRLPRMLGQALSIVGVLVIGEAAVKAGIIGSTMIIIGAFTGITSFVVPPLLDAIIQFRLLLIISSGILGFYGIVLTLIIMLAHMCSLSSFGVPYMAPIAPTIWKDLKDSIVRFPLWLMRSRPQSIKPQNPTRQKLDISEYLDEKSRGDDN